MPLPKILIVEDNIDICELLNEHLSRNGFSVHSFHNAEEALNFSLENSIDLFLLDWMIPGITGIDLCESLRKIKKYSSTPIVMLTAKSETDSVITGLNSGANDYIKKPFDLNELLARIKNQLRYFEEEDQELSYKDLVLNKGSFNVSLNQNPIKLTKSEFLLLQFLLEKRNQVFKRKELIKVIQGDETFVTDRTIDTHMAGLRKKVKQYSKNIRTVRGVGYCFEE